MTSTLSSFYELNPPVFTLSFVFFMPTTVIANHALASGVFIEEVTKNRNFMIGDAHIIDAMVRDVQVGRIVTPWRTSICTLRAWRRGWSLEALSLTPKSNTFATVNTCSVERTSN